jgi:hypothetical protein
VVDPEHEWVNLRLAANGTPLLFGLLMDEMGIGVLAISAGLSQERVPGHSRRSPGRRCRAQAFRRAHQLLEADLLRIKLEAKLTLFGLDQNLCRLKLAGKHGLQSLQDRLQHRGGDGEGECAERVDNAPLARFGAGTRCGSTRATPGMRSRNSRNSCDAAESRARSCRRPQ